MSDEAVGSEYGEAAGAQHKWDLMGSGKDVGKSLKCPEQGE